MRLDQALSRARERGVGEWAAVAAAIGVFGYLGWDEALWDPRLQLVLHLIAAATAIALLAWVTRGRALPHTPIDIPVLALLAAYAAATASAMNHGMSLRAMASVVAFALMLPVALIAVRHRPSWVGAVTSVPVLLLSVRALVDLVPRRVEWVLVGAPGLPPLRLAGETTPFGSVAVPPFVIWPAWALAGLIEAARWRRAIRIGLLATGIPLTILSGSRSAWLAILVTAIVAGVPWLWRRRHRLRARGSSGRRVALMTLGALAVAGVLGLLIAPRLTAVTSVLYRVGLWRDTLAAWATDPLLGIGPGFMPYARQAAAADFTFPARQPHSHNVPLGVLGDAGLVGVLAGAVLVVVLAWVGGPWRSRTNTGRAASLVLLGVAFGSLSEDVTFVPGFNLLAIALAAVALADARAVRWAPMAIGRAPGWARIARAAAAAAAVIALLAPMVAGDVAAIAYRAGADAMYRGDAGEATLWLRRSAGLDPWHPATPKALAVTAAAVGDTHGSRRAAEAAVALNPGDGESWTNLAVACAAIGDGACEVDALPHVVGSASLGGPELVNAALAYERLGEPMRADDAYRRSLLSQRLTAFAVPWPRSVDVTTDDLDAQVGPAVQVNRLLARWATGAPIMTDSLTDPAARALAHALRGERAEAERWLERAIADAPEEPFTWELAVVLRRHWGLDANRELAIGRVVRGGDFPSRYRENRVPNLTYDVASFRAVPLDGLVPDAQRLHTEPPFPWILAETLP